MRAAAWAVFAILAGIAAVLAPTNLSAAAFITSSVAAAALAGIHLAERWARDE